MKGVEREDRLYERALAILYEHRPGLWMPIMRHLALSGHRDAMIELADWSAADASTQVFGTPARSFSPAGLYYRAYRKGDDRAAHNAAMSCFNRNDMVGYRRWLRRAANAGDGDAGRELGHFETRLPHATARKIRRLRPNQKRDEPA